MSLIFCFFLAHQEKQGRNGATSGRKNDTETDDDGSSSDSSDEDDSPRALSYRTPILTQVCCRTSFIMTSMNVLNVKFTN